MSELTELKASVDVLSTRVERLCGQLEVRCPMHADEIAELKRRANGLSNRLWAFICGAALALLGVIGGLLKVAWGRQP